MQPDVKLSKFMFHLKFSNSEEYLNEHELYEVMRSRNLYQNQFGVRSNYKKTMRNIAIAEKAQRYSFENSRKLFVQRMKERREQADKIRMITSSLKPKQFGDRNGKRKVERRYVPIPQSTTIYSEFPAINRIRKINSPIMSEPSEKSPERVSSKTSLPVPPTPSMIAATPFTDLDPDRGDDISPMKALCQDQDEYLLTSKAIVAGRVTPTTVTKTPLTRAAAGEYKFISPIPEIQHRDALNNGEEWYNRKSPDINNEEDVLRKQEEFVRKTKKGRGNFQTSTVQMTDSTVDEQKPPKTKRRHPHSDPTEKCEAWREKHGLVSKESMEGSFFRRLMIDRPSKFMLSHVYDDKLLDAVDLRYRIIRKIAREMNKTSKNTPKQVDRVSDNQNLKNKTYISLPELDTAPKPMATFDPGGTTPDGRLILTRADYDDYLSGYRKARTIRLDRAKKHEQAVGKQVVEFEIGPDLLLHDPTRVKMPAITAKG